MKSGPRIYIINLFKKGKNSPVKANAVKNNTPINFENPTNLKVKSLKIGVIKETQDKLNNLNGNSKILKDKYAPTSP